MGDFFPRIGQAIETGAGFVKDQGKRAAKWIGHQISRIADDSPNTTAVNLSVKVKMPAKQAMTSSSQSPPATSPPTIYDWRSSDYAIVPDLIKLVENGEITGEEAHLIAQKYKEIEEKHLDENSAVKELLKECPQAGRLAGQLPLSFATYFDTPHMMPVPPPKSSSSSRDVWASAPKPMESTSAVLTPSDKIKEYIEYGRALLQKLESAKGKAENDESLDRQFRTDLDGLAPEKAGTSFEKRLDLAIIKLEDKIKGLEEKLAQFQPNPPEE